MVRRVLLNGAIAVGPVIAALIVAAVVLAVAGAPPLEALNALLSGSLGGRIQLARTLSFLLPLVLIALAWIIAFTTKRINLGLEGQIIVGGIVATLVGLHLSALPTGAHVVLGMLGGATAGGLYAGIAAWFWAKRDVNEIISTLMLTLIATEALSWLVRGPMQEPGVVFPRSSEVAETAQWGTIVANSALTWDILLVPVAVVAVAFLQNRTTFGLTLRITGANPTAARRVGINTVRINAVGLILSGAIAGVVGASLILGGETARMGDGFSAGFGFEGIVVALVARNNPFGAVPAALLFAVLDSGSGFMETRVGVASELVYVTQGLVILFVAGTAYLYNRTKRTRVDAPGSSPDASSSATEVVGAG
ncbi:MAG: ABC transporter permease [bacterium]|nr:ABC transporter permease [bacterium]